MAAQAPPAAPAPAPPANRGAIPVVAPATSLTQPAFGAAAGFTPGLIPNARTGPFPAANPGPPPAPAPPVTGVQLLTGGTGCVPFAVPQGISGLANAHVLGCIQVAPAGNMWACSADQVSAPVGAPSCTVQRLNPACATLALSMPPANPVNTAPRALLGCIAPSSAAAAGPGPGSAPAEDAFRCQLADGPGTATCLIPAPPAPPVVPVDEPKSTEGDGGQVEAGGDEDVEASLGVKGNKVARWVVWGAAAWMVVQQVVGGV